MDPIKGPVHSAFVNKSTDAKIMEDLNMQANIIDVRIQPGFLLTPQVNNKLLSFPQRYQPVSAQEL
jgi:hypothetical protein